MTQSVNRLPDKQEDGGLIPRIHVKITGVEHACNPRLRR